MGRKMQHVLRRIVKDKFAVLVPDTALYIFAPNLQIKIVLIVGPECDRIGYKYHANDISVGYC